MHLRDLRRLYDYTEWANERIVAVLRTLSDEQLDRPIESSFPSIRTTLAHVYSAEWIWLRRWNGESPLVPPPWDAGAGASLDTLEAEYAKVRRERRELFDAMGEAGLERLVAYKTIKGVPWEQRFGDLAVHVANHSTYHRGQLTTMIRQVGATPPSTDYIVFVREM